MIYKPPPKNESGAEEGSEIDHFLGFAPPASQQGGSVESGPSCQNVPTSEGVRIVGLPDKDRGSSRRDAALRGLVGLWYWREERAAGLIVRAGVFDIVEARTAAVLPRL